MGQITQSGNGRMRWLLVEAAWTILRAKSAETAALRAWTVQIVQRRGEWIAVVALARRRAGILYAMWRDDVAPGLSTRNATTVSDVSGLVVAPGFWDNHAHLVTLAEQPLAENFLRQGITTVLAPQHSQEQPFPMDAYRDSVRMAPNVGLFAGHTWIRERVMGRANRAPTAGERAWMEALVDSSMQQGALGLATGLEYVPATYATVDEVAALAAVAARHGGIYVTHMRDEGGAVMESLARTPT